MFINNEYTKKYYKIIENSIKRTPSTMSRRTAKKILGYVERHHIIPKSLGGSDNKDNLVWLTAEEHLNAHLLLPYMVKDESNKRKMFSAAVRMCNPQSRTQQRIFKGKSDIDVIREECARLHSEFMKEKHKGPGNPFYGKRHSEESKLKISEGGKGLKRTEETRRNLSLSKLGDKNPARRIVTCPHCNKTGMSGGMKKHHFEHCKEKGL